MGTRGIFTFASHGEEFHVYKHYDSYPSGAAAALQETLTSNKVWPLPRFEADEFAAGFIAANKESDGNFRFCNDPKAYGSSIEWSYVVRPFVGNIDRHLQADPNMPVLEVWEHEWTDDDDTKLKRVWVGALTEFTVDVGEDLQNLETRERV